MGHEVVHKEQPSGSVSPAGAEVASSDQPEATPDVHPVWNVLATAKDHQQRHLARRLRRFGDFQWTRCGGVMIGRVEDHEAFFTQLARGEETEPGFLRPLARLVPVDSVFGFTLENLPGQLRSAVKAVADRMAGGSFYVRVERRGHADDLHSQVMERDLDKLVIDTLAAKGKAATINFKDPDAAIAVEIVGDQCGVGFLPRALRERYPFIKVP